MMAVKALGALGVQETFNASPVGEQKKTIGSSFYRGENCNFTPYDKDHCNDDFASKFILKGWAPEHPFISQNTNVTAFGSCFANNISMHLAEIGFTTSKQTASNIYVSAMGEGLVNVHSILQQFKWALEGWTPPSNLWHGYKAEEYDISEEIRSKTSKVFLNTDVFILTFGLSEVWYDQVSGGVLWRAVPLKHYDANRHKFRVCTYRETKDCISEIISLINRYVPEAKIVMTVSPIPLVTTFRPISCMTANSASKALIKAALDETVRELEEEVARKVYYFPAFEIVNECFPNRFVNDGRHLQPMIVPSVMRLFEATFCETSLSIENAERGLQEARIENVATLGKHPLYSRGRA